MKWVLRLPKGVLVFFWVLLTGLVVEAHREDSADDRRATKNWLAGNPDRATHGR